MPLTNTQKLIISIVVILGIWASQSVSRELQVMSMTTRHEQWMARYGRVYKDEAEMGSRFKIFKENVEFIESFNNFGTHPYKLEVNQFADFRNEEFLAYHTGYKMSSRPKTSKTTVFGCGNMTKVPSSLDWRKKGAVTPIRNETCGAWTFPAVDTVEGLIKIKTGKLYKLSVQEIVDCYPGKNGCGSGFTNEAFDFIKHHGLTTEANYPPKGDKGTCDTKKESEPVAKIIGYKSIPANEDALLKALVNQPVAVTIDASGPGFQFYSGGVFTGECGTTLDHGVTLIGYGTSDDGIKYWLIKNSWGTSWGEHGYMRMLRDSNTKGGLCGIAMEASYPTA